MKKNMLKIAILAVICLFTACSSTPSSPPFEHPDTDAPAPNLAPSVDEDIAKEMGVKRIIYHVGPVDLPAHTDVDVMLEKPMVMRFQTDEPVWVTGFSPRIVDANGSELPSDLLQLAVISNVNENSDLCSDAGGGNAFMAASSVLSEVHLPDCFGYPILSTDPIEAKVILKNESTESYVNVYFELELIAKPMDESTNMRDVKPVFVELDSCNHNTISVAPGQFSEHTVSYSIPYDGKVIHASGILADYAAGVSLSAGGSPSPFWQATAVLDEDHKIVMLDGNPFEDISGVKISDGEEITLDVSYDNFSDSWLAGATVGAMVYVAIDE